MIQSAFDSGIDFIDFFWLFFFDVLIDSAFDFMVDFFMADQLWPLKFWLKRLLSFAT